MAENKSTIYVQEAGQEIKLPHIPVKEVDNDSSVTSFAEIVKTTEDDIGKIADVGVAQELANTEKTQGQDARIARESELQRQAESGGLNESQRAFEQVMDRLTFKPDEKGEVGQEINKHAFVDKTDNKGRRYRILHPVSNVDEVKEKPVYQDQILVFCREGAFALEVESIHRSAFQAELPFKSGNIEQLIDLIDWNSVGDKLEIPKTKDLDSFPMNVDLMSSDKLVIATPMVKRFNLMNPVTLDNLRTAIQQSETRGIKLEKLNLPKTVDVNFVVNGLT